MTEDGYKEQGFGAREIGFGKRPAVLVVDFQRGFTDSASPLGGSPLVEQAVQKSVGLLAAARRLGVPVVQTFVASCGEKDALHWKIPAVTSEFHQGNWTTELDPRIYDRDYDVVVQKIGPSLLFQTPAISYLIKERVDTTIVIGCNTSGCVRATVIDAFSYGFRVMVPHDCCGDVDLRPHEDNLRDVGRRYADVLSLEETLSLLEENAPKQN
ncbi:isochorismatase family protein [Algihabitans albus]|uniref:isochorismatase family protein n=1 Tax=Algihabitans albus TaxID=2164067 RepID=UPI000E5D2D7A|nr:isochorismatase family protein [Algihabitans albus]